VRKSVVCLFLLNIIGTSVAAQQFDASAYEAAVRPVQISIFFSKDLIPSAQIDMFRELEKEMNHELINRYHPLASGSGFFVSERGHLITNYHVIGTNAVGIAVNDAMNYFLADVDEEYGYLFTKRQFSAFSDTVRKFFAEGEIKRFVVLPEGKESELKLIASDKDRDLALLQVAKPGRTERLPLIRVTDSRDAREVYSIGYPLPDELGTYFKGVSPTISSGIVSAMREKLVGPGSGRTIKTIQHTASINPGNSGGPLVTETGLVVGVNSSLLTDANNIYFAISVEEVASWLAENKVSDLVQFKPYTVKTGDARAARRVDVGFTSAPGEAEIYVDDDFIGVTPVTTKLQGSREYDIKVKKDGYIDLTDSILITEEDDLSFDFSLTAGGKIVFAEELPSTIRVLAQREGETRTFEYDEPIALPNGSWAISFDGPISSGATREVAIDGGDVQLSVESFLSSMKLHFPNLLPDSEIILRPSSESLFPTENSIRLPYGSTELLVRTPSYRDNILVVTPDNANNDFEITVDYTLSNAFLSKKELSRGLAFLIAGLLAMGASLALNADAVAARVANTYEGYALLKYFTFGSFVAASAASTLGAVVTARGLRLKHRSDAPVITEYDFARDLAGD
jgi:S1-C subfamily serine protease